MAEAVALAKLHPAAEADQALGTAAIAGRFAENDLIRILTHQTGREQAEPTRAGEEHSLQPAPRPGPRIQLLPGRAALPFTAESTGSRSAG